MSGAMENNTIILKTDCRFFRGDRPCAPHKAEGVLCHDCGHYDPIKTRILIIKLDAVGDVMRTTALLQPLKKVFSQSHVTWLTKKAAAPLLLENPFIDNVMPLDEMTSLHLAVQQFDLVINPDASRDSAMLAHVARSGEKRGFILSDSGNVMPTNGASRTWYHMGLNDIAKKENKRTYQSHLLEIAELPASEDHPILLYSNESERAYARQYYARLGIAENRPVIGLNTGASERWLHKKWTIDGYCGLIDLIAKNNPEAAVVLLGGGDEIARNREIKSRMGEKVYFDETVHGLRQFAAVLGRAAVIVTGDTLALHMAVGLGVRVVGLFGPTNPLEIESYGLGQMLTPPDMECLVCLLHDCNIRPTCMERLSSEMVFQSVSMEYQNALRKRS